MNTSLERLSDVLMVEKCRIPASRVSTVSRANVELLLILSVGLFLWAATGMVLERRIDRCMAGLDAGEHEKKAPLNLWSVRKEELTTKLQSEFSAAKGAVLTAQILEWRANAGVFVKRVLESRELRAVPQAWILSPPDEYRARFWFWWSFAMIAFAAVHLARRSANDTVSPCLLPLVILLCGLGGLVQLNFSDPLRSYDLAVPFFQGEVLGALALLLTLRINTTTLEQYRYLPAAGAVVLGILLVLYGTGPEGTSTKIVLCGFQPVEVIKLLFLMFLAGYFAAREDELRRMNSTTIGTIEIPRIRHLFPIVSVTGLVILLFYFQKDLGPSLILYLTFLGLFLLVSRRYVIAALGFLSLCFTFAGCYLINWSPTVVTRVQMWLNPFENSRRGGSQLAESLWSLASGGFSGMGTRNAMVNAVPAGHTDLVISAVGELWGFPGLSLVVLSLLALCLLIFRTGTRSGSAYGSYLCYGAGLILGFQSVVLLAGSIGLIPLTGIALPLVSYGKTGMIANLTMIGLVLKVAQNSNSGTGTAGQERVPARVLLIPIACLVLLSGMVLLKAFKVMVVQADDTLVRPAMVVQADGVMRFQYNRRLLAFARIIKRGQILDRNGLVLATSSREAAIAAGMKHADPSQDRFYPLGPACAHVLGYFSNFWTPPDSAEKKLDTQLRGYPLVERAASNTDRRLPVLDFTQLVPLFREWSSGSGELSRKAPNASRDLSLSIDARIQVAAYNALSQTVNSLRNEGVTNAAAVILDAGTGEVLGSVSLPAYDPNHLTEAGTVLLFGPQKAALDRTREYYPPGSSFKLLVALVALEAGWWDQGAADRRFFCQHQNLITWNDRHGMPHVRHIIDDEQESSHGWIDMDRGLVESCNGIFAFAGCKMGSARLWDFAKRLHMRLPSLKNSNEMEAHLADDSCGQADISVSPLEMAALAATIANQGLYQMPQYYSEVPPPPERVCSSESAEQLSGWMVNAVGEGTGKRANVKFLIVGGKTGTAENQKGKAAHSWFVGWADFPGARRPISFAFFIEHGGYGGKAAAQTAHNFLTEYAKIGTE